VHSSATKLLLSVGRCTTTVRPWDIVLLLLFLEEEEEEEEEDEEEY
jgi:hypothetical protein